MSSISKTKYIFVTGGVTSSLGKGIISASLGKLLKARGLNVSIQKLDPYINVDPGTMNPYEHGECFVTKDGAETDLDLGHYERFLDSETNQDNNITAGRIYQKVIERERQGDYLGKTVQVIPHITNEIKNYIKTLSQTGEHDIVITEVGGTVGDIESLPFIEAIRQLKWELEGDAISILSAERIILNLMQRMSAIATKTSKYVNLIANSKTKILDTRKTTPGIRNIEKWAVRIGGGYNHRFGLYDSVLLKENHLEGRTDIPELILSAKRLYPDTDVIVEVESIDELKIVLSTEANRALLDNFSIDELRTAYELKLKSNNQKILLEASGNITNKNVREIAETGIDFVSVGALTKNIKAIDLTLLINPI